MLLIKLSLVHGAVGKRAKMAMESKFSESRLQPEPCVITRWLQRLAYVALSCAALGSSSQVLAAEAALDACLRDAKCRQLDDAGIEASGRKDYDEALKQFEAAYERVPLPRLLLNIGRSLHHLGKYQDALTYYDRFRSAAPSIDDEMWQKLARFQAEARERVAPAPIAVPPLPVLLPPTDSSVTLMGPQQQRGAKYPVAAGVLCGLGGAALIAGGGLGLAAMQVAKDVVVGDGPAYQALYERGRAMGWAAVSLGIAGGVLGLVGTVWSIKWSREQRRASTLAVVPVPSGLLAIGSF